LETYFPPAEVEYISDSISVKGDDVRSAIEPNACRGWLWDTKDPEPMD